MKIIILGTDSPRCTTLLNNTRTAVDELGLTVNITKEENMLKIMTFNVMNLPALVIDNKVVSNGKVLTVNEIKTILA